MYVPVAEDLLNLLEGAAGHPLGPLARDSQEPGARLCTWIGTVLFMLLGSINFSHSSGYIGALWHLFYDVNSL